MPFIPETIERMAIVYDGGYLEFDVSISELHQITAQATQHPLEDGAVITDHVRPDPIILTVEAFVSDTPIHIPETHTDGAVGQTTARSTTDPSRQTFTTLGFQKALNRVQNVMHQLFELVNRGAPVELITSIRRYENMIIESCEMPRNAESSSAVTFAMTFRQIRIVRTETVRAPEPKENRGKPGAQRGGQATDGANAQEQQKASALYSLTFGG